MLYLLYVYINLYNIYCYNTDHIVNYRLIDLPDYIRK